MELDHALALVMARLRKSGAGNGRGDPGRAAAEGGDATGASGAVFHGMDTTDRLPIAVTSAAYRRPGDARQQLSRTHAPG